MTNGLHCGRKWDKVHDAWHAWNPDGRAPPTQPSGFRASVRRTRTLLIAFRGTFEHALDAKHRLTIPAKFRAALAGGVVLAASPETTPSAPRSIAIWTPDAYDTYTRAALAGLNPLSTTARDLKRFFFGYSHDTELDSANRVMIPPGLMEYAGLDKEVVVTGSGECLEVFDRSSFGAYSKDVLTRVPDIAASLGDTA
jgi:transcriptional regulator MraZ